MCNTFRPCCKILPFPLMYHLMYEYAQEVIEIVYAGTDADLDPAILLVVELKWHTPSNFMVSKFFECESDRLLEFIVKQHIVNDIPPIEYSVMIRLERYLLTILDSTSDQFTLSLFGLWSYHIVNWLILFSPSKLRSRSALLQALQRKQQTICRNHVTDIFDATM